MACNFDDVLKTVTLDPNEILRRGKLNLMLKYQNAKEENPTLTQDQLCHLIGTTRSTLNRSRQDLKMNSFYRYSIPLKPRSKASQDRSVKQEQSTNTPKK